MIDVRNIGRLPISSSALIPGAIYEQTGVFFASMHAIVRFSCASAAVLFETAILPILLFSPGLFQWATLFCHVSSSI